MKKFLITQTAFCMILIAAFLPMDSFAQWSGSSNISGNIYRNGNVGLQVSSPYARLDILSVEGSTGGPVILKPHLRFRTTYAQVTGQSNWDITATSSLNFDYGITTSSMGRVLSLGNQMFDYRGSKMRIGVDEERFYLGVGTSPLGNPGHYLAFGTDYNTSLNRWDFTGNSTNNGGTIIQGDDKGNLFFITRGTSGSNTMTAAQTAANIKMVIYENGKISIGTEQTEPDMNVNGDDYLLFVKGGTLSEEVAVRTGWADYVFNENYKLLPLEAVETHILEKGHLHNTPSAAELNGTVNLGDATVQQQEKIEEIYLHLIELNKEVKQLKSENEKLKQELNTLKQ